MRSSLYGLHFTESKTDYWNKKQNPKQYYKPNQTFVICKLAYIRITKYNV